MLTTDQGARRARDGARYRRCLSRRKVLTEELARLKREGSQLLDDTSRRGDLAMRTLMQVRSLDEERDEVRDCPSELEREIERLRNDPATQVAVPDHLDHEQRSDQFQEIEREIDGQAPPTTEPVPPTPVRDPAWLTIPETADVLEVSYPWVARWANAKSLPFPDGDPRNPWQADAVPIDATLGPRRRRLAVSGINPRYLAPPAQRRRLAEILARFPAGWSEEHCRAPLRIRAPDR
jgi:hypothetical protein